jgi:pimeloyl-ACP methyl ester carboxylesterase
MATVVLVHGAWQSAATWDLVAPKLRDTCDVHIPLLTGLEPAAGALTPEITLDTHVGDVLRLIESRGLEDVTLVGHSYAGMIITGVAEHAHAGLARLVYVDAFVPDDGQSALQLLPPPIQAMFRDQARAEPDGFRLRGGERQLDLWGLKEGPARDFVRSRLCDFSLNCFAQPLMLPANAAATLDRAYIACVGEGYPAKAAFDRFARRARAEGWQYYELPTGHDCHVEMPDAFSGLLANLTQH